MTDIIKRETPNSTGFDTQVYRAICKLFDKISIGFEHIYCAVELEEDVFSMVEVNKETQIELEEDKDYSTSFSFNSPTVRNSLVSFFDQYIKYKKDPILSLVFYAQTTLTYEKVTSLMVDKIKGLKELDIGHRNILKKLCDNQPLNEDETRIALSIFQHEYISQYTDRLDKRQGFKAIVNELTYEDFLKFLSYIDWSIIEQSNEDLEHQALEKIRNSEFYDYQFENKEELILGQLFHEFTKKKANTGFISRLFSKPELEVVFLKAASEKSIKNSDESWKTWRGVSTKDIRQLRDKIIAVCPNFPNSRIDQLYDKVSLSKVEEVQLGKDYMSLKVRVLMKCSDLLDELIDDSKKPMEIKEVKCIFKKLEEACNKLVIQLTQDYTYKGTNEQLIQGIIYALFDECFLALDCYE